MAKDARVFEGYAARYELDLGGDVIEPGAFRQSLAELRAGRDIPLLDSHNPYSVRNVIGHVVSAKEDRRGLWAKIQVIEGVDGDELLHRIRGPGSPVSGLSIGYNVPRGGAQEREDGVRVLNEIEWHELSVTAFPMNLLARIQSVEGEPTRAAAGGAVRPPAESRDEDQDDEPDEDGQVGPPDMDQLDRLRLARLRTRVA